MPLTKVFEPSRPDETPETRALVEVQGICDGLVKRLHISSERYLNEIEVPNYSDVDAKSVGPDADDVEHMDVIVCFDKTMTLFGLP